MLYAIGLLIILAGCYIGNPIVLCAGGFVIMASNNTPAVK